MKNKRPLLSICVPTYNGASSFLKEVMESLVVISQQHDDIEIIVSNNCSTDSTKELLINYSGLKNYHYHENEKNIGFNNNMLLLTDNYASGKYCWVIGDDDVINPSSMDCILNVLSSGKIEYLSLSFSVMNYSDYTNIENESKYDVCYSSFSSAIDINAKMGNTLGTFMSSSIFLTEKFRSFQKELIINSNNSFNSFFSVFPNAYIISSVFYLSPCAYIPQSVIYAITHHKTWTEGDNSYRIVSKYSVDLFKHFISLGIPKKHLLVTYKRLLYLNIINGYLRLLKGNSVSPFFFQSLFESYLYPSVKIDSIRFFYNLIKQKNN